VESTTFGQIVVLNGVVVTLSSFTLAYSADGQVMTYVASNDHIAQVEFDHDGAAELIAHCSSKPSAVYADDRLLVESSTTTGLTANSNAWVYDQNSGTLQVFADPSSITMFYGGTPVPELPSSLISVVTMLTTLAALATVMAVRKQRAIQLKD
jgi:hypothetical protein